MSLGINTSMVVRQFTDYKNYLQQNEDMAKFKKVKKKLKSRRDHYVVSQKKLGNIVEQNIFDTKDFLRQFNYHQMNLNQLTRLLHTDGNTGLTQEIADSKLKQQGQNKLPEAKKTNNVLLFLLQMSDPFSLFIWGIVCLCIVLFGVRSFDPSTVLLAIILVISIVGGAIISFLYNRRTEDTLIEFNALIPQFCNAIRNSKLQLINASQLVPGDIVQLGPGDKIPADCRAIQSSGLHVNNSLLTGQSDAIKISIEPAYKSTHVLDCSNMLFAGCITVQGQGKAIVVGTGEKTIIAQITNQLIKEEKVSESTVMQKEITRYVAIMTIWSVFMFVIVLIVAPINGFDVVIAFEMGVGVMVASCPSVLNLVLIILMTHVVRRLSTQNMIVKNFYNLEALGATTCLCTDKTGTITINNMSVSNIYYNGAFHKADNFVKDNKFNFQYDIQDQTFKQIHKCAILSSVAKYINSPPKTALAQLYSDKNLTITQKHIKEKQLRSSYLDLDPNIKDNTLVGNIVGDPTESALIRFFNPIQSITKMRNKFPILKNKKDNELWLPFNSNRKYSLSVHQQQSNRSKYCAYTKGAPEIILEMCTHVMMADGREQVLTQDLREQLKNVHKYFTKKGERVIGFAKQYEKHDDPSNIILNKTNMEFYEQIFLGFTSFNDPPRLGIANSITRLRVAGIKVFMITGDHAQTAATIARQTNIIRQPKTVNQLIQQNKLKRQKNNKIPELTLEKAKQLSQAIIVTGDQLIKMKVEEQGLPESQKGVMLKSILQMKEVVFARTTPTQKLEIVQTLQKMGQVVTVTGDGVNDSPAIKRADVGICMFSGSDASREAADVVLTDDNLFTIVDGIKQGRRMFDNMKKTICYVMTSQVSQFVPFLILISLRIPIPIFTLLIDGIVDFLPTISLAYQEAEQGIMTRRPRDRTQHLVNMKLLGQCSGWMGLSGFLACFLNYWICMNDFGFDINHLWGKSNIPVVIPQYTDTYNPSNPYFGNTNLQKIKSCQEFDEVHSTTDWINAQFPWMDLRMSAVLCHEDENGNPIFTQNMVFIQCLVQQISVVTNRPICYTTQATKYGQTSYMMGNVVDQIFNLFICKTRRQSVFTQGMNNKMMWVGLTLEYLLTIGLTQFYWLIYLIGTRDLLFIHFGIASVPVGMAQFLCDEIRKFLIRNVPKQRLSTQKEAYKPNWFQRNTLW